MLSRQLTRSRKAYPGTLRRVGYWDEETRRSYVFVTNNTTWVGKECQPVQVAVANRAQVDPIESCAVSL